MGNLEDTDFSALESTSKYTQRKILNNNLWAVMVSKYYPNVKIQLSPRDIFFQLLETEKKYMSFQLTKKTKCMFEQAQSLFKNYKFVFLDKWVKLLPDFQEIKNNFIFNYKNNGNWIGYETYMAEHGFILSQQIVSIIEMKK